MIARAYSNNMKFLIRHGISETLLNIPHVASYPYKIKKRDSYYSRSIQKN